MNTIVELITTLENLHTDLETEPPHLDEIRAQVQQAHQLAQQTQTILRTLREELHATKSELKIQLNQPDIDRTVVGITETDFFQKLQTFSRNERSE